MEITDILQRTWDVECIGCAITIGTMTPPGGIIAENASCCVHQDPEVPLAGFLVLGVKRHVQSLIELTTEEYQDFAELLRVSRKVLCLLPNIHTVSLIQEERSSHFHLWLFPWYQWMIDRHGSSSLSHIRPIMAALKHRQSSPKDLQNILTWVERMQQIAPM